MIAKNGKQKYIMSLGYQIDVKLDVSVIRGGMRVLEKIGIDLSKFELCGHFTEHVVREDLKREWNCYLKMLTKEKRKDEPGQGKLAGAWTVARGRRAVLSSSWEKGN
jgi:hypothetical protein